MIERLGQEDIQELNSVFKSIIENLSYYNDAAKRNELGKYTEEELKNKIAQDPDSVFIAKENNKIVGFCFSKQDDMLIWLEWFGVIESARKKGIGKSLIKYLESSIKNRNAHKIWCDCRTGNIKSISILSSSGYLPICTVTNHWYGQDFILWQKEIR